MISTVKFTVQNLKKAISKRQNLNALLNLKILESMLWCKIFVTKNTKVHLKLWEETSITRIKLKKKKIQRSAAYFGG